MADATTTGFFQYGGPRSFRPKGDILHSLVRRSTC